MNEWQREQLDEDRDVIRMPHHSKGAARDHPERDRVHHLHVPVLPESVDDPPAQSVREKPHDEHRDRERGNQRAAQDDHFRCGADWNSDVQEHHPEKIRLVGQSNPFLSQVGLTAPGYHELYNADDAHDAQEAEERDNARIHFRSDVFLGRLCQDRSTRMAEKCRISEPLGGARAGMPETAAKAPGSQQATGLRKLPTSRWSWQFPARRHGLRCGFFGQVSRF